MVDEQQFLCNEALRDGQSASAFLTRPPLLQLATQPAVIAYNIAAKRARVKKRFCGASSKKQTVADVHYCARDRKRVSERRVKRTSAPRPPRRSALNAVVRRPPGAVPPTGGGTCYAGAWLCSLRPCTEFAAPTAIAAPAVRTLPRSSTSAVVTRAPTAIAAPRAAARRLAGRGAGCHRVQPGRLERVSLTG